VVEHAARVETQIATECCHAAMSRSGNRARGFGERPITLPNARVACEPRQRHAGTQPQSLVGDGNAGEVKHRAEIDEPGGTFDSPPQIWKQTGSAGEQASARLRTEQRGDFRDALWTLDGKRGHAFHLTLLPMHRWRVREHSPEDV